MRIQVKRKLSSIRVAEPLTSVDLNRDGSTLALGDTRGQVWIYDLRATQQPLHLQKSAAGGREGGPTSSVSFLSPDFASSSSSRPQTSVKRGATKTTSNSAAAIYDDIKENLHKNNQLPPDESGGGGNVLSAKKGGNNDSVSSLFSPLRESSPAVGHLPTSPGRHLPNDNSHLSAAPDRKLSTDSFFSPLRENTSITNIDAVSGNGGSFCRTPKTAPSSAFNSPLTSIKEESGKDSPVKTKKSIVTTLQHQLLAQVTKDAV